MNKLRNPIFLLAIGLLLLGVWKVYYTIKVSVQEQYQEDEYFGYIKADYEKNYPEIYRKISAFDEQGYSLEIDFTPQVGSNLLRVAVKDAAKKNIAHASIVAQISRPMPTKNNDRFQFTLSKDPSNQQFFSPSFNLQPYGSWILRIRAELDDSMVLTTKIWEFSRLQNRFIATDKTIAVD